MKPRIAIGIPAKNGTTHLQEAISSACNQTESADEIVIFVHGGTDPTEEINSNFPRVAVVFDKTPFAIGDAWNRIYQIAKCEWVLMLHADDILSTNAVAVLKDLLFSAGASIDLVVGRTLLFGDDGEYLNFSEKVLQKVGQDLLTSAIRGFLPGMSGMCARRDLMCADPFRSDLRIMLDIEFYLRWFSRHQCSVIAPVLANYRIHAASTLQTSGANWRDDIELLRSQFIADELDADLRPAFAAIINRYQFLDVLECLRHGANCGRLRLGFVTNREKIEIWTMPGLSIGAKFICFLFDFGDIGQFVARLAVRTQELFSINSRFRSLFS